MEGMDGGSGSGREEGNDDDGVLLVGGEDWGKEFQRVSKSEIRSYVEYQYSYKKRLSNPLTK